MQSGKMHPDWMQWIPCSVVECSGFHAGWRNGTQLNARIYAALLNAVDLKSKIECSGFYAAWPKASRLNAVDSMHCDWIQFTPCTVVKCIPIECSGLHALCQNSVDSMQREEMELYWMQWIYAARWNAVDVMQHGPKHPDWMQWIPCSVI